MCAIVGGMSIQKQIRILKFKPTIIVATPGRLWELMNDHVNPYLLKTLPMMDVMVLDEADRMIADGHFKELKDILAHIYTQRVKIKTGQIKQDKFEADPEAIAGDSFKVGKSIEGKDIDWSKVKDLYDDE